MCTPLCNTLAIELVAVHAMTLILIEYNLKFPKLTRGFKPFALLSNRRTFL